MPRSKRYFMAPVCWEETDIPELPGVDWYQMPGLTTMMQCQQMPPGARAAWPPSLKTELVGAETPADWERFSVACIPWDKADKTRIYASIGIIGDVKTTAWDEAYAVIPANSDEVREGWRIVELAIIPLTFWAEFGDYYDGAVVDYYDADYRLTIEFEGTAGNMAPSSWIEYRPKAGEEYPPHGLKQLSDRDLRKQREAADERVRQLMKGGN